MAFVQELRTVLRGNALTRMGFVFNYLAEFVEAALSSDLRGLLEQNFMSLNDLLPLHMSSAVWLASSRSLHYNDVLVSVDRHRRRRTKSLQLDPSASQ